MNGIKMAVYAAVDWIGSIAYDRDQRWEFDCPYCDETHHSRSYNMVLLKNSLHHEFAIGDGDHPSREEMSGEKWSDLPEHTPELVRGSTQHEHVAQ